jgi:membrane fusion protein, multidrug efflux system
MTVTAQSAGYTQEFAAEVRARTESRLGFRVGGKMTSRSADLGDRVKAGEVLAQLDPADLRLGQEAARAALRAAEASHALAAAELKRYKELKDQGFISGVELDRRETNLLAARSQLDQARAQANVQGNQAGYAALVAPAAGVITAVEAEPGAVLAAGTPVLRLAQDGPRDAVFSVPEDAAGAFRAMQGRAGALQVRPWGAATLMTATVREVAAAADPTTRTFLVKADLGAAPVQLGQTLTVLVPGPRAEGVAKLPLSALFQADGKNSVWLLDTASMSVRLQPVAVAGADANSVVIASGLSPGQTVVTAGVHVLTPGQKVKYYGAAVAAAASAPGPAASR